MQEVHKKTRNSGMSALALAFVLPHENKPMRLPVVPATLTALLDTMVDGTMPVPDGTARRAFLCRDPTAPLWTEKQFVNMTVGWKAQGSATSWNLPAKANTVLANPMWDRIDGYAGAGATIDGVPATSAMVMDHFVMGNAPGTFAFFVPPNSNFWIEIVTGAAGGGSGIEFEFVSQIGGEEYTSLLVAPSFAAGFQFVGVAGSTGALVGTIGEGVVPIGFTYLKSMRTTGTAPTAFATPTLQVGWATYSAGTLGSGTITCFSPYAPPPEFNNSTLPYGRTRLNSSAALFTNVTAALSKEGTVLCARLKPSVVDPWSFASTHINSVHPSLRYFGPLEKGLYTFTTPSGNLDNFNDHWCNMPSNSAFNAQQRPLFDYVDIGLYNACIFSDLGSAATGTQLAVSAYSHLEFETTSSLFSPGVSFQSLESLHLVEAALLKFGHFHENPLHWAALRAATMQAMKVLGPMVAPYVQQFGTHLLNKGVSYLRGRQAGDRQMTQNAMQPPARTRLPGKVGAPKKAAAQKKKRKGRK
jgi:hypothetical protein